MDSRGIRYLRGPYEPRFSLNQKTWEIWTPEAQHVATVAAVAPHVQAGTAHYLASAADAFWVAGGLLGIDPTQLVSPNVLTTMMDATNYARRRLHMDKHRSPIHAHLQRRIEELFRNREFVCLAATGTE